jgi:uncharacterized protein
LASQEKVKLEKVILARPRTGPGRIFLRIGVGLVLLALVAYFGIGFIAAGTVTTPRREFSTELTPANYQLTYEDIKVKARADGMEISGWYIPCEGSSQVVIMVPGRDQSRTSELYGRFVELANYLHKGGLNVTMLDLRGHGQSPEAHYSFGLRERYDVEGAVDWLKQKGFPPGSIGAFGVSMGAASCIGAAAEEPGIRAIAEDSGFAEIYPILRSQWETASGLPGFLLTPTLWMIQIRYGYDLTQARPVKEIPAIAPRPILIIHSNQDALVPVENARQLQAAYPTAETWILKGPEHARSFNDSPEEYAQRVITFFHKGLK